MSAAELIKQVESLPPQERAEFEHLLHAMKPQTDVADSASRPRWPDFGERLQQIYGEKVAPDSQSVIDEGRGDR